jgi:putative hemolysin
MLSIDKVNVLYDRNITHAGPAFARNVLKDLGVRYDVLNPENLDSIPEGPFITISNHPYGGIDGIILVDLFGHLFGDYKVMVNKFLDRVETLKDNFICVTPTGKERTVPTDDSIKGIKTAMRHVLEGGALGLFPSGAVSDLSLKDLCVRDRVWQEPVIRLIQKLHVPVLPVTFLDRNSDFYYSLGLIDWKVRLLRLPSEVFNKKDKMVRVAIGKIITPETILEHHYKGDLNSFLRSKVYEF